MTTTPTKLSTKLNKRFRGFLPIVIDVETGGFDAENNALLEVAAVILGMDDDGQLVITESLARNVEVAVTGAHHSQVREARLDLLLRAAHLLLGAPQQEDP